MEQTCAICGVTAAESKTRRLVRDHDHATRMIRGLLCDPCNGRLYQYESGKSVDIVWLAKHEDRIKLHLTTNTGVRYYKKQAVWRTPVFWVVKPKKACAPAKTVLTVCSGGLTNHPTSTLKAIKVGAQGIRQIGPP